MFPFLLYTDRSGKLVVPGKAPFLLPHAPQPSPTAAVQTLDCHTPVRSDGEVVREGKAGLWSLPKADASHLQHRPTSRRLPPNQGVLLSAESCEPARGSFLRVEFVGAQTWDFTVSRNETCAFVMHPPQCL